MSAVPRTSLSPKPKPRRKLLVFASGSKDGGGSGLKWLIWNMLAGVLNAEIVGVVSNHANGGVKRIADEFGIRFYHLIGPFTAEKYQALVAETQADFVALSGWLKMVRGLPANIVFNIHPGLLPETKGLHGDEVHERMIQLAKEAGKQIVTNVCMHFVPDDNTYDGGPRFFEYPVPVFLTDTVETLRQRISEVEHGMQSVITNLVVTGQISWSGRKADPVEVSAGYYAQPFCPKTCVVRNQPAERKSHLQLIRIRPEKIEEYTALHANPPVEILHTLHDANVRDYRIGIVQYDETTWLLVASFEYIGKDWDADQRRIAECPHTQAWWKKTDPCQEPIPIVNTDSDTWWSGAEIMFDQPLD